jgi:hypothetical protein
MVTSGTPETTPSKAKAPSSSVSSPPAKNPSSASKKIVIIDGVEYDLEPTPKTAFKANVATSTKADRAKMDVKEKTDLFERATAKKLQPKFTMMNLKIDDPDKLDDTYNLAAAIDTMKENHIKYDLHDVFKIVYFDSKDPTLITKTVDLYTDYGSVEVADVAKRGVVMEPALLLLFSLDRLRLVMVNSLLLPMTKRRTRVAVLLMANFIGSITRRRNGALLARKLLLRRLALQPPSRIRLLLLKLKSI